MKYLFAALILLGGCSVKEPKVAWIEYGAHLPTEKTIHYADGTTECQLAGFDSTGRYVVLRSTGGKFTNLWEEWH